MTTRLGAPTMRPTPPKLVRTSALQCFPGNVIDVEAKSVPMGPVIGSEVELMTITLQLKGAHFIGRNEIRPVTYAGDCPAVMQLCMSRTTLGKLLGALTALSSEVPESNLAVSDEELAMVNPATEATE